MARLISYYANNALLPLFFIVCFVRNFVKLTRQSVVWAFVETCGAYKSNQRKHGISEKLK